MVGLWVDVQGEDAGDYYQKNPEAPAASEALSKRTKGGSGGAQDEAEEAGTEPSHHSYL